MLREKEEEPSIFPYEKAASRRPHESESFSLGRSVEADFQVLWGIGRGEETSTSIDRDALKASAGHNPLTLPLSRRSWTTMGASRGRAHPRQGRSLSPICHWRALAGIAILINLAHAVPSIRGLR